VIRTVWLAVLCFSGVAAAVAMNAGTSTPPPTMGGSPEQTTLVDAFSVDAFSRDTLTKADKLEIAYVRDPVAAEPIIPVTLPSDEIRPQPRAPIATQKIVSPRPHAGKAGTVSRAGTVTSQRRIKIEEPKKSRIVERGKVTADRPCRRPDGIAGLLRAFNLSPRCDS
jgi:hypothetical protein